jgi:hypothetical protein
VSLDQFKLLNKVLRTSTSTASPFTVSAKTGSAPFPVTGEKYYAFIEQLDDAAKWANVGVEVTGVAELTVLQVFESSETDRNLPTFTGGVRIDSAVPAQRLSEYFNSGRDGVIEHGQSNMLTPDDGAAEPFDVLFHHDDGIFQLGEADKADGFFVSTREGVYSYQAGAGGPARPNAIGYKMAANWRRNTGTNRQVCRIPNAVGATSIEAGDWGLNDPLWQNMLDRANAFINENPHNRPISINSQFGESDTMGTIDPTVWRDALITSINSFRGQLATNDVFTADDAARLPFIIGEFPETWASGRKADFLTAINEIPALLSYSAVVSATGTTTNVSGIHFTEASALLMGQRHYDAYETARVNELAPVAPGPVGTITVNPGETSATYSWSPVTGIPTPTYDVERGPAGGPYVQVATGLTQPTYNDSGLIASTNYEVRVTAVNTEGTSLSALTPFTTTAGGVVAWGRYSVNTGITGPDPFTWADQEGTANRDMTQTGGAVPVDEGVSGVDFAGNKWLRTVGNETVSITNGLTYIVRFILDVGFSSGTLIGCIEDDSDLLWVTGSKLTLGISGGVASTTNLVDSTLYTFAVTVDSGNNVTLYNVTTGTAVSDGAGSRTLPNPFEPLMCAFQTGSPTALQGNMHDCIIYDQVLTTGDIESEVAGL